MTIFNLSTYRDMLASAKRAGYSFIAFVDVDGDGASGGRCLLRHDVDANVAAALTMAQLEHELGITATYFLMLRSPLYNLMGRNNHQHVEDILALGHAIGLHYDQGFDLQRGLTSTQTSTAVEQEAQWLERQFSTQVAAVSFHQPGHAVLQGEISTGTRINTYDSRHLADFAYFSDSNRQFPLAQLAGGAITEAVAAFAPRNLQLLIHPIWWVYDDPSTEAVWDRSIHSNLQAMQKQLLETERAYGLARQFDISALTHPGSWQDKPMPPKQHTSRSTYGRSGAMLRMYDEGLDSHGRENLAGAAQAIRFLKPINQKLFELCDYLWNTEQFQTLFIELWCLHERQINTLCKAVLRKEWEVPACEVNAFFENPDLAIDGWRLFVGVFDKSWQEATGIDETTHTDWVRLRNQLVHGHRTAPGDLLEAGCLHVCKALESLAAWGMTQPIAYDGLAHLGTIGIPAYKTADGKLTDRLEEVAGAIAGFPTKRWERFKSTMSKVGAGETVSSGTMAQSVLPRTDPGR